MTFNTFLTIFSIAMPIIIYIQHKITINRIKYHRKHHKAIPYNQIFTSTFGPKIKGI